MHGLKFTDNDFFTFQQVMALAPAIVGRPLNCLTGPDEMMVGGLAMGSHGAIGSTYNLNIALNVQIYNEFKCGNVTAAAELQAKSNQIIEILIDKCKCRTGGGTQIISGIKAVYAFRGFDCGEMRGFSLTPDEKRDLIEAVEGLRFSK
jgi:N-acetylneuraminate lyase